MTRSRLAEIKQRTTGLRALIETYKQDLRHSVIQQDVKNPEMQIILKMDQQLITLSESMAMLKSESYAQARANGQRFTTVQEDIEMVLESVTTINLNQANLLQGINELNCRLSEIERMEKQQPMPKSLPVTSQEAEYFGDYLENPDLISFKTVLEKMKQVPNKKKYFTPANQENLTLQEQKDLDYFGMNTSIEAESIGKLGMQFLPSRTNPKFILTKKVKKRQGRHSRRHYG